MMPSLRFHVCPAQPIHKVYSYNKTTYPDYPKPILVIYSDTHYLNLNNSTKENANYIVAPFCVSLNNWRLDEGYLSWADSIIADHCKHSNYNLFFDSGDYEGVLPVMHNSIVFKTSLIDVSAKVRPIFYPVPRQTFTPLKNCIYDISFQGRLNTHEVRSNIETALRTCQNNGLQTYFKKVQQRQVTNDYQDNIRNSRFVLCPRGRGQSSVRFYETMSFGRLPILLADHAALPLNNLIDYNQFVVTVPENDILNVNKYIESFIATHDIESSAELAIEASNRYFSSITRFLEYALRDSKNTEHH